MITKNEMKNYLLSILLLFGILITLNSCYQEDVVEKEDNQSLILKRKNINQISKLKPIIENVKKMKPKGVKEKNFSDFLNFENLNTDEIIEITDVDGNSTFTFEFENTANDFNFENLHLIETQDGYISYILSYEPDIAWYESLITENGLLNLDMANYQGNITKYNLDREIIWSTDNPNLNKSSSTIECSISIILMCTEGWNGEGRVDGHVATSYCNNHAYLHYEEVETCTTMIMPDGEGNTPDGESQETHDCNNISGSKIVDDQPLSGIDFGCASNNTISILPSKVSLAVQLETLLNTDLSWQIEAWLNQNVDQANQIREYLEANQNSRAQTYALNALTDLFNQNIPSFNQYVENTLDTPLSVFATADDFKFRINLSGYYFNSLNSLFSEAREMLASVSSSSNLCFDDLNYVEQHTNQIYNIVKLHKDDIINIDVLSLNGVNNLSQVLSANELATIEINLVTVALFPSLKNMFNDYWPQTAEEWSEFGDLLVTILIEIVPGLIPGVAEIIDVKNAISAFNNGNYKAGSTDLAMALIGVFPVTKALKSLVKIAKATKIVVKLTKAFRRAKKMRHAITNSLDDALVWWNQIGINGDVTRVRVVEGASEKQGKTFFELLTKNAVIDIPVPGPNPGDIRILAHMPDGSTIQFRNFSTQSPNTFATLDFAGGNYDPSIIKELKFNP